MKPLSKREETSVSLFDFVGIDYALLTISHTGLDKGYTDATVPFRDFLKRTGIHDYSLQTPGEGFIKYVDVFGLTAKGPELLRISFQRPATKGGRMYRVSMLGGLKRPLAIQEGDALVFFVRDNQLHIANLTQLTDRAVSPEPAGLGKATSQGPTILKIAKSRIIFVMESMPQCEPTSGTGARAAEIGELSGMFLEKHRGALVNALLDELRFEGRIELTSKALKKYRLCHSQ